MANGQPGCDCCDFDALRQTVEWLSTNTQQTMASDARREEMRAQFDPPKGLGYLVKGEPQ